MSNDIDNYKKGSEYEIFIHRANRNSDNSKTGAHGSVIQNLISAENGDTSFVKYHGTYENQFLKVKTYMHKAMDKYLKMKKIPHENRAALEILKNQIDGARSSDGLMKIIRDSIVLTQCVKDY